MKVFSSVLFVFLLLFFWQGYSQEELESCSEYDFDLWCEPYSASSKKNKYNIAICAIFQDEAAYLKEWIEYHKLIGVERFYLYNNRSQDDYLSVLKPYLDSGLVKLTQWDFHSRNIHEWNHVQCSAYNDALSRTRKKVKWLAFIDIDEFILPIEDDHLSQFLEKYDDCAGVCINWQVYGTSWIPKIPDSELLIEALTLRAPDEFSSNLLVKSIVKPKFVSHCINPHFFIYRKGYNQVDINKRAFTGAKTASPLTSKIRLNHYLWRDQYWLIHFKIPRYIRYFGNPEKYSSEWIQEIEDTYNVVEDSSIYKYLKTLKKVVKLPN